MNLIAAKTFFKGAAIGCLLFLSHWLKAQNYVQFVSDDENLPISNGLVTVRCNDKSYAFGTDHNGFVNLPECEFPVSFQFKHISYADSGMWQAFPPVVIIKKRVISVNEARVITSNQTDNQNDVLIVVRMTLNNPGTSSVSLPILSNFNGASLSNALNAIPGVRFDERGQGGSRRLNIRGNYVRSAFGVRSIPIYLDNIPLTGPEGSSPLEVVDQELIQDISIQKGVAAVNAGAANGGALLFSAPQIRYPMTEIIAGVTMGSNNYLRQVSGYMWSDNKHSLLFRQIHQQTEGYREQESNRKNQFFLRYSKHRPNGNSLSFTSMYYIGSWDLPGSINAEEVNDNPQMARPYSLSANASVDKTYLLNALTYASDEYSRTTHKTSIFLNNNDKINPYGTSPFFAGYKDENSVVIGLRNSSQTTIDDFRTISYGGEFQSEYGKYKEYTNNEGEKDILKYNNKTNFFSGNLFTSYRRIFRRYRFNFGVNAQIFNYSNEGYSDVLDSTLSAKKFYKPVVLPSIEIKKSIFTNSQVYILTRRGNSWPGLFELVDVETGFINRNLQIENTLLLESGIMGYSDNDIGYSFDIYTQALQNPILPGIDSLERISYYNGKNSHYFGAEFSINKLIEPKRIVKRIYIAAHGAFQRYYADKKLALLMPGVPLSTAGIEVRINHQSGLQLDVLHRYTDRLPLNDDNSTFLSSNHIIHANLSWTKNIKNFSFQLSAGINNISNTSYTGFPQLNATLGRYYNPAALQNYFAGFRLTYKVIKN